MPFEHVIEEPDGLLVVRGSGVGSLDETEDSARRIIRAITDGEIPAHTHILINVDGISLVPNAEETLKIAQFLTLVRHCSQGRIAIVAAAVGKVVPAQLMAMHSTDSRDSVRAFTQESKARDWLLA